MSVRNSLTVVLPLREAGACQLEIEQQRPAIERGWANVAGLNGACLAVLPGGPGPEQDPPALLWECTFEGEVADLMSATFARIGAELSGVLEHCLDAPVAVDERSFADYVLARARRSWAFGPGAQPKDWTEIVPAAWRLLDALRYPSAPALCEASEAELEARRLAVGMQEPLAGVPLVHVAWLLPGTLHRTKRALRDVGRAPPPVEHDARFLLAGTRLVFVASPSMNAQRWSERLSQQGLEPCARLWRNSHGFSWPFGARRARRARRLQEFVLEHRIPVAAWFNARAPHWNARTET